MAEKKWYNSSANPEKVSLSIKGFGVAIIPAVVLIASFSGFDVKQMDLVAFVNAVATAVSGLMIVFGLGRKIFIGFLPKA